MPPALLAGDLASRAPVPVFAGVTVSPNRYGRSARNRPCERTFLSSNLSRYSCDLSARRSARKNKAPRTSFASTPSLNAMRSSCRIDALDVQLVLELTRAPVGRPSFLRHVISLALQLLLLALETFVEARLLVPTSVGSSIAAVAPSVAAVGRPLVVSLLRFRRVLQALEQIVDVLEADLQIEVIQRLFVTLIAWLARCAHSETSE